MTEPKISIITPSFNQGKYIETTILSVINQNYSNLEYIIIDGGSTDNTIDIIKKYEGFISYWVSEPDRGQAHAINKGFKKATGEILGWINSDDWYEENIFRIVGAELNNNSTELLIGNCTICYSDNSIPSFVIKPNGVSFNSMLKYWKGFFCPPQPSIFFSKSLLDEVGLLDEGLNYAMDLDLWLRLSRNRKFKYIDENFSYYLIHSLSKSGSADGFEKFTPEWKYVCKRNVQNASFADQIRFYISYLKNKIGKE